ncbi:MAG: sugar-binding transcriptional regulator [Gammaproteobacteria bacterium]|nr:sugar-binding transcriptional regulator [Gammaproteobacteria bacterium]
MARNSPKNKSKLDDAARAGWLYYVAKNTQDEIARKMEVSRQSAQRLVALALDEGLIKFRLDHPVAQCMALAEGLKDRYGLNFCEVTLADPSSDDPALGIAQVAADAMEKYLKRKDPVVMALGTGKEIYGAVRELSSIYSPQHRIVSLVGSLTPDGSANINDPIAWIGDLTQAPRHPLSVPVLTSSQQERDVVCAQKPIQRNIQLAKSADVAFIGIGELNDNPPMFTDGFLTWEELKQLQSLGAVGEILGWTYDKQGELIANFTNDRVTSVPLDRPPGTETIGVARGENKLPAIRGALRGQWLTGLITDEMTAQVLLDD